MSNNNDSKIEKYINIKLLYNNMLKKLSILSFLLLFSFFSVNATLTTNLQSYYSFDNTLNDLSGNGFTLTNNGAIYDVNGKINGNYVFGANRELTQNTLFGTGVQSNFSTSFWFNMPSNQPQHFLYSQTNDYVNGGGNGIMSGTVNGKIIFQVLNLGQAHNVITTNTFNINTWYHIVETFENGVMKIYVDGVLQPVTETGTLTQFRTTSTDIFRIGTLLYNGLNYNPDVLKIDELGIWNNSLTQSEVTKLYNNGAGLSYSGFVNPINLVVNTPLDNFNYTYDVPQVLFNVSTSISTSCSYTYNNVTTLFSNTGGFNHSSIFNLPAGINQTQTFNIEFGCTNTTYSQYKNITFYKQQVPLALDIIVPQENQIFNIDTSQIEFYLQTNYVTDCNYKRDNDTFYTPFTSTHSWEHKSNFTTDLNVSTYNMNFFCTGIYVNENVSRNITFFLDNLNTYSSIGLTRTSKQLPQVGNDIGNFMKNSTPGITEFIFNLAIVSILVTLLVVTLSFVKTKLK